MNKSKGFTIIELIVVIAIIAVLAAIVLVNVTQYINKGKDSAARGDMASLMTNMAAYYDTSTNGFSGAASSTAVEAVRSALAAPGMGYSITWGASGTDAYCALILLKNTNEYCVDSTGNKIESSSVACDDAHGSCH